MSTSYTIKYFIERTTLLISCAKVKNVKVNESKVYDTLTNYISRIIEGDIPDAVKREFDKYLEREFESIGMSI